MHAGSRLQATMSTMRSASSGPTAGGSEIDLAGRLYRQGGGQPGLPRLVSTGGRQPFTGGLSTQSDPAAGPGGPGASQSVSSTAHLRKAAQRHAGGQVLVPHTNYRPITLPGMDASQAAPQLQNTKSGTRLIGTRNASVPQSTVGIHNLHGMSQRGLARKEEANVQQEGSEQGKDDMKVDPSDPSWISPADFVEFILNHESLTEEFCYMNRSGPYEFEIVPFSKINPNDYMTISIRGVTHYANGELDYQDLSEWQRDQEMYRKIIKISFFEKYQRWKLFSVWKSAMRNQRVQKCSRTLNAHLFALDMTLRDSLIKCRALCVKIAGVNLLEIKEVMQYELSEFEKVQSEKRKTVVRMCSTRAGRALRLTISTIWVPRMSWPRLNLGTTCR